MNIQLQIKRICDSLQIKDERFIEIERKRKLKFEDFKELRNFLTEKSSSHEKTVSFFDQYLDTEDMAIAKKGASLRIRYKQDGAKVYVQYKGPGFLQKGILFRSEFNSGKLPEVVLKESHNHFVRFDEKNIRSIMFNHLPEEMFGAMEKHLGHEILSKISTGNLICFYKKEKFIVNRDNIMLEPSIDKICTFYVRGESIYPMATFCEYENEIKAEENSLEEKLNNLHHLVKFDAAVVSKFRLKAETKDKYHRCLSFFI
ncbi:MAG: CYTH domain-containing protein [Endomicrobia bacterium]|nr:CYTH domain-containing protein [Endomicrobiia bacterium]MCL2506153.1 CYTH domain-containing protein [Endomicrobiia bacterium]